MIMLFQVWLREGCGSTAVLPARVRKGRPLRLLTRAAVSAAAAILAVILAVILVPGTPAAPAVATGCALWWLLTARTDLAPPPGR